MMDSVHEPTREANLKTLEENWSTIIKECQDKYITEFTELYGALADNGKSDFDVLYIAYYNNFI